MPAPCLIPSLPTCLPIPQIKKELVVSFRFSRTGITSPYDSCTKMHSVSRFCTVETPGMRAGLWKEPRLFAHGRCAQSSPQAGGMCLTLPVNIT